MSWWILFTGPSQSVLQVQRGRQVFGTVDGHNVRAGPYRTLAAAEAALATIEGGAPAPSGGGGGAGGGQLPGRGKARLVTRAAVATAALVFRGASYVYGGNASRVGEWDCSSFVSFVLGYVLRMRLPGGGRWGDPGYPPNDHGPVVIDYARWDGAVTISGPPSAGDLCIWPGLGPLGHIGIAISGSQMISALDPSDGTKVTPIDGVGPSGVQVMFRRLTGAAGKAVPVASPGLGKAGGAVLARLAVVAGLLGVSVVVVVAALGITAGVLAGTRPRRRTKAEF